MSLLLWNTRRFFSHQKPGAKFSAVKVAVRDEWEVVRNTNDEGRDSIWFRWRKGVRSTSIEECHSYYIHERLARAGGYFFDITVVYREAIVVRRRPL